MDLQAIDLPTYAGPALERESLLLSLSAAKALRETAWCIDEESNACPYRIEGPVHDGTFGARTRSAPGAFAKAINRSNVGAAALHDRPFAHVRS
jgi:hypothetical protein